jgi:glycine/D-amino acid oxidase-like deaminating enzyme
MHADFLLVGQGIAGSLLYYALTKVGANCIVIDDNKPNSASRVAAGLINPVTGRRLVKSWMIDDLIPALNKCYRELEKDYQIKCIYETELTWHFPAPDIVEAFNKRIHDKTEFLAEANGVQSEHYFHFPFKAGIIQPCYIVDVQAMLDSVRSGIENRGRLLNEQFEPQYLRMEGSSITYKDLYAKRIIFCDGSSGIHNPWFSQLPYSLNKGEALIVSIKDLPRTSIYKFKQTLVPLPAQPDLWWYGSNYIWKFDDDLPTKKYREISEKELRSWLKSDLSIVDHKAAIRYATVERRPFIGFHPAHPNIGIFNGWGTKGCSLVPYFAEQFARHLMDPQMEIHPEADIKRFTNVLLKA